MQFHFVSSDALERKRQDWPAQLRYKYVFPQDLKPVVEIEPTLDSEIWLDSQERLPEDRADLLSEDLYSFFQTLGSEMSGPEQRPVQEPKPKAERFFLNGSTI